MDRPGPRPPTSFVPDPSAGFNPQLSPQAGGTMRPGRELDQLAYRKRCCNFSADCLELLVQLNLSTWTLRNIEGCFGHHPLALQVIRRAVEVKIYAVDPDHRFRIGAHLAPLGILVPPCGCTYCGGIFGAAAPELI